MIARLLILGVCVGALPAAELVVRDLRIALGTGGTDFDYAIHGSTVDAAGSDTFDSALSLGLGGRWSFTRPGDALGLVVGTDVSWESMGFGSGSLQTIWGRGSAGLGWAVTDFWTMTGEAGVMFGHSTWEVPGSVGADTYTADGNAFGYDLRIDATRRIGRRIGAGGFVGWQSSKHDLAGGGLDSTLDRSGWIAGVMVFWRFSNAPATLQ